MPSPEQHTTRRYATSINMLEIRRDYQCQPSWARWEVSLELVVSHLQRLPSGMALGGGLAISESSAWDIEANCELQVEAPGGLCTASQR